MKLDKATLLKQKFWVLLFVSLPITLGAIFLLVTSVSGEIARAKATLDSKLKGLKTPEYKTPADIAEAKRAADVEKADEKRVWEQAWDMQKHLFLWPEAVESEFNFQSGKFAQQIKVYRGQARPPADAGKADRHLVGVVDVNKGSHLVVKVDGKSEMIYPSTFVSKNKIEGGREGLTEVGFEGIVKNDHVVIAYHEGKYFGEPLTIAEMSAYRQPLEVYMSQIVPILSQVEPMNAKGEGVVQLRGWWYDNDWDQWITKSSGPPERPDQRFLVYLRESWQRDSSGDISEEAWLAQEDLWIQKELFRLIRLSNDYVSKFEGVTEADKKGGADKNKFYTYKNPYWELGLKLAGNNELIVSLKNLQSRRQKLGVNFRIWFNGKGKEPETFLVDDEPLGPSGTPEATRVKAYPFKENLVRTGIFGVEQVLTWETAAVKRIDNITIGSLSSDEYSHSHRTFAYDQFTLKRMEVKPVDPLEAKRVATKPKLKTRIDVGGNDLTKHNLIRNRYLNYLDVTPQSRRVPVAVVLIVDQDHVDRVLTAFGNSMLRFVTQQFAINRYPGSLRPVLPNPNLGIRWGNRPPPPGTDLRFLTTMSPETATPTEMESNIELVLHGTVTLYERTPPPLQLTAAAQK
jgi:hypothetical protein